MKMLTSAPILLALTAATAPQVEVASGDWSALPTLQFVGYGHVSSAVMSQLYSISRTHQCRLPGQAGNHIDFSISFAAQFDPHGRLQRLLLPQLNCPAAESWLGATLLQSLEKGDYRPTGENQTGWYQGQFGFYYEG